MQVSPEIKKEKMLAFLASQPARKETIIYSKNVDCELEADIFLPTKEFNGPRPAVVYVHGGGFVAGDKHHFEGTAAYLTQSGFVGLCINYRLATKYKYPSAPQDVMCAIRYLKSNAKQFNIDPNRIGICGSSAGGNLAGLGAYANDVAVFKGEGGWGESSDSCKAAVLFCGIYDFQPPVMDPKFINETKTFMLGGTYEDASETYREASPIEYVNKSSCPTFLLHGDADGTVTIQQSINLKAKLDTCGVENQFHIVKGGPHNAWDFLKPDFDIANKQMETFLLKYL